MADLSAQIEAAAPLPQSTETDGLKVTERPLTDLIEADKYLAGKEVAAQPAGGIRFVKLIPPGA